MSPCVIVSLVPVVHCSRVRPGWCQRGQCRTQTDHSRSPYHHQLLLRVEKEISLLTYPLFRTTAITITCAGASPSVHCSVIAVGWWYSQRRDGKVGGGLWGGGGGLWGLGEVGSLPVCVFGDSTNADAGMTITFACCQPPEWESQCHKQHLKLVQ